MRSIKIEKTIDINVYELIFRTGYLNKNLKDVQLYIDNIYDKSPYYQVVASKNKISIIGSSVFPGELYIQETDEEYYIDVEVKYQSEWVDIDFNKAVEGQILRGVKPQYIEINPVLTKELGFLSNYVNKIKKESKNVDKETISIKAKIGEISEAVK